MADTTHAADHAASSGAGMPQLDFSTFPNQIFWLIISLIAIYLVLHYIALPRIAQVLAERSGTITNDLAAAEDLKAKAAEAEAAYEKALADARAEASRIVDQTRADIQADLNAELAVADEKIAAKTAEGEAAIAQIRSEAATTARSAAVETAEALVEAMGGKVDAKTIASVVDERIKA